MHFAFCCWPPLPSLLRKCTFFGGWLEVCIFLVLLPRTDKLVGCTSALASQSTSGYVRFAGFVIDLKQDNLIQNF